MAPSNFAFLSCAEHDDFFVQETHQKVLKVYNRSRFL